MSKTIIVVSVLFVIVLGGYLAACAGAGKMINVIDWLLLRSHK